MAPGKWVSPSPAPAAVILGGLFRQPGRAWRGAAVSTAPVVALGTRLLGRAAEAESAVGSASAGDAGPRRCRRWPTSEPLQAGEVALPDWEDVSAAPGVLDLAWLLVSPVDSAQWDKVIAAYGPPADIVGVLPAVRASGGLGLTYIVILA